MSKRIMWVNTVTFHCPFITDINIQRKRQGEFIEHQHIFPWNHRFGHQDSHIELWTEINKLIYQNNSFHVLSSCISHFCNHWNVMRTIYNIIYECLSRMMCILKACQNPNVTSVCFSSCFCLIYHGFFISFKY